jgi:zinc protease
MNVLVGGDEAPAGFPGMAHAEEHMAFRGCTGMTADQTAAIYAQLGDDSNAETEQNVTEYYATVPATDLNVALQAQAMCLDSIQDSQADWEQERGAIEQEVAADLSEPTDAVLNRVNADMFAGTPYAHDALGTKISFDVTTGAMLKDFYRKWYTPSNTILVVVGDIDPVQTLIAIKRLFGSISSHTLPPRPAIKIESFKPETYNLDSSLGYSLGFIAYRLPGTDSPDYAATQVLADVLDSQRANLYGLVPAGKAWDAQFNLVETYPKASVGFAVIALPEITDPVSSVAEMRRILTNYAKTGVPRDLVSAAKRTEIAAAEFDRTSIPGLARAWSDALASEGRTSPEEDTDAIRKVTMADVNRVARQYLLNENSITAIMKPLPTRKPTPLRGSRPGAERIAEASTEPVPFPEWAAGTLEQFKVPETYVNISDTTLPNGIRLIVRTDTTSPTVTLLGSVKHNPDLQIPAGREGLSDLVEGLYSYGTQTLDRLAFQEALDDIAANETAGYHFSLNVLKENFSRGVELLADNELHPALKTDAFAVTKQEMSQFLAGLRKSAGHRTSRALKMALLPVGDPNLREATPATVSRITLNDVEQYRLATIRPDLTTIVIIGDVSQEDARAAIDKWFGDWKSVGPEPNTLLPGVPPNKSSTWNVVDPDQIQDLVVLTEQLQLNRLDADYYPLQLGTYVLGGGFQTTLSYNLRKVTGYVYSVDVSLNASPTRASYSVSYACSPKNVSRTRALIERDINQMRTEDIPSDELHRAQALLARQTLLSESSEEIVAQVMLGRAELGLPLDEPIRAAKRYSELNAQDVRLAFARAIRTDNLVQVVQGPALQ